MSQKVQSKRLKKKRLLAEKAIALLTTKGPGFSLSDIAVSLKMGRTTIYEYFKDKEEILAFYLEEEIDRYHLEAMEALSGDRDWRGKIHALLKVQLKYAPTHRRMQMIFQALKASASPQANSALAFILKKHHEIYHELAKIITHEIKIKNIRDVPPLLLSEFILNSTSIPFTNDLGEEELAGYLLGFLLEGVTKNPGGTQNA